MSILTRKSLFCMICTIKVKEFVKKKQIVLYLFYVNVLFCSFFGKFFHEFSAFYTN